MVLGRGILNKGQKLKKQRHRPPFFTKKVTYIDLMSEGTVDEFIIKNLRGKINLANKVLGEDLKKWLI